MAIGKPYEQLASVKAVLDIAGEDTSRDAVLSTILMDCSDLIDEVCNRTFTLDQGASRRYEAPASSILWVDDLQSVTSVTLSGSTSLTLTPDQWELQPYNLVYPQTAHDRLVRLSGQGGVPVPWAAPGEHTVVTIVGDWGYTSLGMAVPPAIVVQACQIMAVREYYRYLNAYKDQSGTNQAGMQFVQLPKPVMDPDVRERLQKVTKKWHFANKAAG